MRGLKSTHTRRSKVMLTFKQFCRFAAESSAKGIDNMHQVYQREKKIKKLLSISNHWKGLN